jgi:hypothetical protein
MVGGEAPAGELPAAEPLDTSAPVPALIPISQLLAVGGAAAAALALVIAPGRQRRHLRRPA